MVCYTIGMKQLTPPNFGAIAKQGVYVYCYITEHGKPYYVGVGTRADRAYGKHSCEVPPRERIVILRSGLTKPEAINWEAFYIKHYGRQVDGGLLVNKSKRGAAKGCNYKRSAKYRQKMADTKRGTKLPAIAFKKSLETRVGKPLSAEHRQKLSEIGSGRTKTSEHREKIAGAHLERNAAKYGFTVGQWLQIPHNQRKRINRWLAVHPSRTTQQFFDIYAAA